jgi:hypothetical protein
MANNPLSNKYVAKASWDFATTNGSGGAESISAHNGPIFIPEGALITKAYYFVDTTVADNGDDSTIISIGYTGAVAAFSAALLISGTGVNGVAGGNFDAGIHGTLVGFAGGVEAGADAETALENIASKAATLIHTDADVELLLTVGASNVHTLNAGKLTLYVEYVQTGDLG